MKKQSIKTETIKCKKRLITLGNKVAKLQCPLHGIVTDVVDYKYCGKVIYIAEVPIKPLPKPVSFQDYKKMIRDKILSDHKMSVAEFAREHGMKIGKGYNESTLRTYLADGDVNNSLAAINDVALYLFMPKLLRETKVVRTNLYFIEK